MLVSAIPDTVLGTGCWVLAPAEGGECVVVDPGFSVAGPLAEELSRLRLRPAAVVLTHGHADHVWSAAAVARAAGAPVLLHPADRWHLADPLAALGPLAAPLRAAVEQGGLPPWEAPDDVRDLDDARELALAGLELRVHPAPGHTDGSVVLVLDGAPTRLGGALAGAEALVAGAGSTALTGDVLFAGSVGRTDLPGGDAAAMARSLARVVAPMPDDRLVLPGHGPATTVGAERATNPHWPR